MTEANANRKVVLVAEDSAMNRALLKKIFSDEYTVEEAENGAQALYKLRALPRVDLIIMDIMMPEMDGFEALARIRQDARYAGVPVIVATAESDDSAQIRAFDLGAEDVFTKPYNPRVLLARANNVIFKADGAALRSRVARQEEQLRLAQRDALTGLYSRDAFCETAARLIAEKPPRSYVITCFDIDNFKIVNDQYGPETGNSLLVNIADTIRKGHQTMGDGIAARVSADNFAALLPASTPPLIESMAAAQREFFEEKGVRLSIYMSAGRYLVADHQLSVTAMLDRAILAKRTVKGRYGNNVAYFNEKMRLELLREQTLVSQMESALKRGEFEPWLQLQFNHATKAVTGAEALVRWKRPDSPPIFPGEFIALFERNGFIYEVDKAIWRQVCALLRRWLDEGTEPMPISVNISRCDVFHDDFFDVVTGLVREFDLPVGLLRLEITESAFAEAADSLIDMVKRLRAFGFVVEIDDFGSGYSSLNTLKDVPADVLKLDMRFLATSEDAKRGRSIVESIVRMAEWLDMTVIAEGVETLEEAEFLRSVGCVYIQGYFYAKPLPVAECEKLMRDRKKDFALHVIAPASAAHLSRGHADADLLSLRRMLTEAVENIPAGIAIFEQRGDSVYPIYVSDNVCDAFGFTRVEYDGRIARGEAVFSPALTRELLVYHAHSDKEIAHERILLVARKDGTPFDLRVRIRKRLIDEKIVIYCTLTDVTRQMESERQRRIQDERYRLLVEMREPIISDYDRERDTMTIIVHKRDGTAAENVLHHYMERLGSVGIMLPDSNDEYVRLFRALLIKPSHGSFTYHADYGGGARWYRAFYSSLADAGGTVSRSLFMAEDITAEYHERRKLLDRAEYDPVTRLLNRASADELLPIRLAHEKRSGMDALYMIDIDDFKLVNDSLGHQAGDLALRRFADTLRRNFRAGDMICRYGGDEFLVLMPSCGSPEIAMSKARGLIERLAEDAPDADSLRCSVGVTMVKGDGTDVKTLLRQADIALYLSKRRGKNTCTMYDETMEGTAIDE